MRDSIFLAAILTAALAAGVVACRTAQAAVRWAIGRVIVSTFG
jgi:hypothetical protein